MSFVYLSMAVFGLGVYGLLTRRDLVAILASVEVMLGAATMLLVGLTSISTTTQGAGPGAIGSVGLVIIVLAAAEASVGLALAITVARRRRTTRIDELTEVRG